MDSASPLRDARGRGPALRGSLDRPKNIIARNCLTVFEGWALATGELIESVVVRADEKPIGVAEYGLPRPDVAANFPEHPQSQAAGFRFEWREIPLAPEQLNISIEIVTGSGKACLPATPMRIYETLHQAAQALRADNARWQSWLEVARQYQLSGDEREAACLLREACGIWPDVAKLAIRFADLAVRQQLFSAAKSALQSSLPFATQAESKLIAARLARVGPAAELDEAHGDTSAIPATVPGKLLATLITRSNATGVPLAQEAHVMTLFESIGHNCEFGLAQRAFKLEPISLLRFSMTPFHQLIKGLAAGFAGVGEPENTVLKPTWGTEYGVSDTRYNLLTHTEVHTTSGPDEAELYRKQCQRLRFLRRKFLEDLEGSSRIFVFQRYDRLKDEEVRMLAASLGVYNRANRLLCVRLADDDHPPATMEWIGEATAVGYIAKFSNWQNVARHVSPPAWLELCNAALASFDARMAGSGRLGEGGGNPIYPT